MCLSARIDRMRKCVYVCNVSQNNTKSTIEHNSGIRMLHFDPGALAITLIQIDDSLAFYRPML